MKRLLHCGGVLGFTPDHITSHHTSLAFGEEVAEVELGQAQLAHELVDPLLARLEARLRFFHVRLGERLGMIYVWFS